MSQVWLSMVGKSVMNWLCQCILKDQQHWTSYKTFSVGALVLSDTRAPLIVLGIEMSWPVQKFADVKVINNAEIYITLLNLLMMTLMVFVDWLCIITSTVQGVLQHEPWNLRIWLSNVVVDSESDTEKMNLWKQKMQTSTILKQTYAWQIHFCLFIFKDRGHWFNLSVIKLMIKMLDSKCKYCWQVI